MSEEKKFQRGGVTPEQEDTLKEVTGGWGLDDDDDNYFRKLTDCNSCSKQNTDACPYRSDMKAYYHNSSERCKVRS